MTASRRWLATISLTLTLPITLAADTLILRNGQRIQGDLIAVRGDTVEFEEQRNFGGRRTIRVDRDEIDRIEFDRNGSGNNWNNGGGGSGGWNNNDNGRPNGMRERQSSVSATTDWSDTGIDVRAGQTIYVSASGQVRWGRDRRDGPQGENNSPFNAGRPLPNRPAAALIGRIGNDVFFIGNEQGAIRVRNSGRLYLGINDDYLADNSGSFRVTVFY
ncbi:MAG: hypothetical protein IT178_00635 [Acidobacteria bacterium]|nr:hypothetical protein [Acidobacteriota bacterium]